MGDFTEKINLDDLYSTQKSIQDNKIQIYNKILARVHKKIKITSKSRNCEKHCFYLVPEFILGIPVYDTTTCITYIIDKLLDNGFHVRYTHPNLLFISWNHYIPYHTRMDIKKKHGVNVDGFGNVVSKKNKQTKEPEDINSLMFKKNEKVSLQNKSNKKEYKSINTYKPTGNFIYSNELLSKIDSSISK
tara:strand:+ start:146 stop:712 length:567 start_codon:yes stop_codon:yes gene_type:complete